MSHASEESSTKGRATELAVLDVASGGVVPLAEVGVDKMLFQVKFSPEGDQVLLHEVGRHG